MPILSSGGVLLENERDYCFAHWGPVFFVIWRKETTLDAIGHLRRQFDKFAAMHPSGVALFTVVESGADLPPSHARDALAGFMRGASEKLKLSAVAFEGTGFRAAAVRGVVTSLTLLARQPFPHKVFATVEAGAQWLATEVKKTAVMPFDGAALGRALADLRREIADRVVA
jgi:hypothetical protein